MATMANSPTHNHTLIIAHNTRNIADDWQDKEQGTPKTREGAHSLEMFMQSLIKSIGMTALIPPKAQYGRYGWTGIAGIVTSHIAFHFFEDSNTLQFDVYSCKEYDIRQLIEQIQLYWKFTEADIIFMRRDECFQMKRYKYNESGLHHCDQE